MQPCMVDKTVLTHSKINLKEYLQKVCFEADN